MIHNTLINQLPTFLLSPDNSENHHSYVYEDCDFMPFTKLKDTAVFFKFQDILEGISLPNTTLFAIVQHHLNEPTRHHHHNYVEICFIAEGRLLQIIDHEPLIMDEGHLNVVLENQTHLLAPLEEPNPVVINFLIHPYLFEQINHISKSLTIFKKNNYSTNSINILNSNAEIPLKHLILNYIHHNFEDNLTVIGALLQFLYQIENINNSKESVTQDPLTLTCLELIKANPKNITQQKLAEQVNFSPSYLSRHIKKTTGITISELIMQEKLRMAQILLATSNLLISDIINQIGYSSESHFFKIFKEKFGITPNYYRELMTR